jgi:hypothetical protein
VHTTQLTTAMRKYFPDGVANGVKSHPKRLYYSKTIKVPLTNKSALIGGQRRGLGLLDCWRLGFHMLLRIQGPFSFGQCMRSIRKKSPWARWPVRFRVLAKGRVLEEEGQ